MVRGAATCSASSASARGVAQPARSARGTPRPARPVEPRARSTMTTGSRAPVGRRRRAQVRRHPSGPDARRCPASTCLLVQDERRRESATGESHRELVAEPPHRAVPAVGDVDQRQGRGIRNQSSPGSRRAPARAPRRSRTPRRACRASLDCTDARRGRPRIKTHEDCLRMCWFVLYRVGIRGGM